MKIVIRFFSVIAFLLTAIILIGMIMPLGLLGYYLMIPIGLLYLVLPIALLLQVYALSRREFIGWIDTILTIIPITIIVYGLYLHISNAHVENTLFNEFAYVLAYPFQIIF